MSSPLSSIPLVTKAGAKADGSTIAGKVVALYFSAHWCPPCKAFTPVLRRFYEALKGTGEQVEIIFVSSDRSEQEFLDYFRNEHGDWLAVDFNAQERGALSDKYSVKGIPTLIVVNSKGENVVPDARNDVAGAQSAAAIQAAYAEWKKVAGDWRESAGTALGGGGTTALPKDPAALRAARLAALEGRLGGGTPAAPVDAAPAVAAVPTAQAAPTVSSPPAQPAPTAVSAPTVQVADAEKVAQLTAMGFNAEQAQQALSSADGDVEQAINLLAQPAPTEPAPAGQVADAGKVAQLTAMGFSEEQARQALASTDGDAEQAINLLLA